MRTVHSRLKTHFSAALFLLLAFQAGWTARQRPPNNLEQRPILVAQLGHTYVVSSVAFSPDGALVATGSHDNTAHLWHAGTGRELRSFRGHSDWVRCVAFAPDNQHLLTGSADNTARLWDAQTARPVVTFSGHTGDINAVTVSSDGAIVATASDDRTARLWDAKTGRNLFVLAGHTERITSLSFAPNGALVVTGGDDGMVRLWNTRTGELAQTLSKHTAQLSAAVFAGGGKHLLTASWDRTIRVWDARTGQPLHSFERKSNYPYTPDKVAFSPDGRLVAMGGFEGLVGIWNVESGQELPGFQAHQKEISALAFSPNGKTLLTASHDHTARLWDPTTRERLATFEGYSGWVSSASFSADGKRLLTHTVFSADNGHTAWLWDFEMGKQVREFRHKVHINGAQLSPDGQRALTTTFDAFAHLWDVNSGELLASLPGYEGQASGVPFYGVFSPNGSRIVTAGVNLVCVWDGRTGSRIKCGRWDDIPVQSVAFLPNGEEVLLGLGNKTARIWNINTEEISKPFEGHTAAIYSIDVSPNGKFALTGSGDTTARLWDVRTRQQKHEFKHSGSVHSVAFSPDGTRVLTGSDEGLVNLWDVESGVKLRSFTGHAEAVWAVGFSPDGKRIVTGSGDHTMRLWETDTGHQLCTLINFADTTWAVVDPEGRFDTNNLEEIRGLHWIMPDDPLRPLPLEIFMRDYYQPGLLTRILNRQPLVEVRPLEKLNRAQPAVTITRVVPQHDTPHLVDVTVHVSETVSDIQHGNTGRFLRSGAYDLRLFRDGQIVADTQSADSGEDLDEWRRNSRISLDAEGKATVEFKSIQLPKRSGVKEVVFSAYAFNEERVKSATAQRVVPLLSNHSPTKPRAYVLTVGVSEYQNPAWNLSFAAKDAVVAARVLVDKLAASGEYEPIAVSLTSDTVRGKYRTNPRSATKANFREALELLAGIKSTPILLKTVANADKLKRATPDDLVLIFFSSHGIYRKVHGVDRFYFLPYDIGPGRTMEETPSLFEHSISSDEVASWLKRVDAGELVLIANACQSEASVANQNFRPGPFGNRGLGQLAYDKRMRILAASQTLASALEAESLSSSLLTTALFKEGLQETRADYKPKDRQITLNEWLRFAEERVPQLSRDLNYAEQRIQRPVLFEFLNNRKPVALLKLHEATQSR